MKLRSMTAAQIEREYRTRRMLARASGTDEPLRTVFENETWRKLQQEDTRRLAPRLGAAFTAAGLGLDIGTGAPGVTEAAIIIGTAGFLFYKYAETRGGAWFGSTCLGIAAAWLVLTVMHLLP